MTKLKNMESEWISVAKEAIKLKKEAFLGPGGFEQATPGSESQKDYSCVCGNKISGLVFIDSASLLRPQTEVSVSKAYLHICSSKSGVEVEEMVSFRCKITHEPHLFNLNLQLDCCN